MKHLSPRDSADRHGNSLSRMPVQKVDDTQPIQQHSLNGFAGEQMETIEHMHQYGFTNVPVAPSGGEGPDGMTIFMGSNRTHGIVLASADRRFRLNNLKEGDVALHDNKGHQIHIAAADGITVSAPNSKKIHFQVMNSDALPQSGPLNQTAQAGKPAAPNSLLTKDEHTDTHPKQNTHQIINGNNPPPSGGDVSSQLSGMVAQAQALVTAAVGLPGIQDIGSQISGMGSTIIAAGGTSGIASAITSLGTSMSTAAMSGMSSIISSLTSQVSALTTMLNPTGALSQVLHTHVLDAIKGITHSVFQGQHSVTLGTSGIKVTSTSSVATTSPSIPHNGQVFNSDNTHTTGSDFAAAFPVVSDISLKTNINDHPSVLDDVMSLRLKTFDVKAVDWETGEVHSNRSRASLGIPAQDVQKVFPLMVHDSGKFLAVEESKYGLLAIAALQEFVSETREENARLRDEIEKLKRA